MDSTLLNPGSNLRAKLTTSAVLCSGQTYSKYSARQAMIDFLHQNLCTSIVQFCSKIHDSRIHGASILALCSKYAFLLSHGFGSNRIFKMLWQNGMSTALSLICSNGSKTTQPAVMRRYLYLLSLYADPTLFANFSNWNRDGEWSFGAVFPAQKLYLVHRMNSSILCTVQNTWLLKWCPLFPGLFKIDKREGHMLHELVSASLNLS